MRELFTYTYVQQKGKWVFVSAQHSEPPMVVADEEAAIKKVIEQERTLFATAQSAEFLKLWKDDPKTFHLGRAHNSDNEAIKKIIPTLKPTGKTAVMSNYRIKIKGDVAIADFDQEDTNTDGSKETAHDVVML